MPCTEVAPAAEATRSKPAKSRRVTGLYAARYVTRMCGEECGSLRARSLYQCTYCIGYIHRSFISKRVLVGSSYWYPPNSHTLPLASFHLKGVPRAPTTFVAAATP